jgi:antitoxin (DNA-binding transcriptional repressor) of toxin-antitoxin stability system
MEVIVQRGKKPVAKIVPIRPHTPLDLPASEPTEKRSMRVQEPSFENLTQLGQGRSLIRSA